RWGGGGGGGGASRGKVSARGGREKVMPRGARDFIRRFLLHVVPTGLVRIRYYGLLANRHRQQKLDACRRLLRQGGLHEVTPGPPAPEARPPEQPSGCCPSCQKGRSSPVVGLT